MKKTAVAETDASKCSECRPPEVFPAPSSVEER